MKWPKSWVFFNNSADCPAGLHSLRAEMLLRSRGRHGASYSLLHSSFPAVFYDVDTDMQVCNCPLKLRHNFC